MPVNQYLARDQANSVSPIDTVNYSVGISQAAYRHLSGEKGVAFGYSLVPGSVTVRSTLLTTTDNGISWHKGDSVYNTAPYIFWEPNLPINNNLLITSPTPAGGFTAGHNQVPVDMYGLNEPFKFNISTGIFSRYRHGVPGLDDYTPDLITPNSFPNLSPPNTFPNYTEYQPVIMESLIWPGYPLNPQISLPLHPECRLGQYGDHYIKHRFSNVIGRFFRVQKFVSDISGACPGGSYGKGITYYESVCNFAQYSVDTSLMLFATNANAPYLSFPDSNTGVGFGYCGTGFSKPIEIYPSVYLGNNRILVEGTNASSGSPGLCRIGGTYSNSLKPNSWPALKQWYDNAPCYWCKTFNRDAEKLDTYTKVSFCDSLNGFAQTVDNMKHDGTRIQMAIYSTTNGGETWQNGTRFYDTTLVIRPFHLIACARPGVCYFITDAGKLFKTTDYGKTWSGTVVTTHLPYYKVNGADQQLTNVSATDTSNIWVSFGDSLYVTGTGGGTNWQSYTDIDTVNNVRLYTPGRITAPMLGVQSAVKQNVTPQIKAWYYNNLVHIQLQSVKSGRPQPVAITDIIGRPVATITVQPTAEVQTFNIPLEKGVYMYRSQEGTGKLAVW